MLLKAARSARRRHADAHLRSVERKCTLRRLNRKLLHREVFGEEKDRWWKRADAAYTEFPAYRARASREIPVLVLEPLV